ncbi:MAG: hypothetical protein M0P71_03495 [Melioribacteraceae bacterium]|nr:hypothetical protein [Melioribacteraceae bacterium]
MKIGYQFNNEFSAAGILSNYSDGEGEQFYFGTLVIGTKITKYLVPCL